jgi:hypothetical protein
MNMRVYPKIILKTQFQEKEHHFYCCAAFQSFSILDIERMISISIFAQKTNSWATQIPLKAGVDYITTTKWVRMILLNIVQSNTIQQNICQIKWEREREREREKNNTKYNNLETVPKSNRKIVEKSLSTIIFT